MTIANQATQQKFPFAYECVYDGLNEVLPKLGITVKNADKIIGRVTASTGMSLFSWGENLTFVVEKIDATTTQLSIESSLKVGINAAGAHRHQKNFNDAVMALSKHLQANAKAV